MFRKFKGVFVERRTSSLYREKLNFMKLRIKYIIAFILTALMPIAVLGYLSYSSAKKALREQAVRISRYRRGKRRASL